MKSSHVSLITAILLSIGATVCAQQTPPALPTSSASQAATDGQSGLPAFDELDKSHHGYLSRRDIPKDVAGLGPLRAHFKEFDKDNNGRMSPNEYAGYVATRSDSQPPQM